MASRRRPGRARTNGLGQHFLRRPERCATLVATAGLSDADLIVEIDTTGYDSITAVTCQDPNDYDSQIALYDTTAAPATLVELDRRDDIFLPR